MAISKDYKNFAQKESVLRNFKFGMPGVRTEEWSYVMDSAQKFLPDGGIVLDWGCGRGVFPQVLSMYLPKHHIILMDRNKGFLNLQNQASKVYKTKFTYATSMDDIQNKSLDGVSCVSAIEHNDGDGDLAEFSKIIDKLKVGGYLFLTVPGTPRAESYMIPDCKGPNKCFHAYNFDNFKKRFVDNRVELIYSKYSEYGVGQPTGIILGTFRKIADEKNN